MYIESFFIGDRNLEIQNKIFFVVYQLYDIRIFQFYSNLIFFVCKMEKMVLMVVRIKIDNNMIYFILFGIYQMYKKKVGSKK